MTTRRQPHPHQRGLGWEHRNRRTALLRQHHDGAPCPCTDCGPGCPCRAAGLPPGTGLPMYRDAARNADRMPLEADHVVARAHGGTHADRLLLATCNRSRGATVRTTNQPQRYWSREW